MRYYGTETEKALSNFGPGSTPAGLVRAMAEVKKAALYAIQESESRYPEADFRDLNYALDQIIAWVDAAPRRGVEGEPDGRSGHFALNFPLPLSQGGAGTSLNMNVNEVAAALASERARARGRAGFDPIEDLNRHQSTNDVFGTAVSIAALRVLGDLEAAVVEYQAALCALEARYPTLMLLGRTEMQDALPMTFSQMIGAYAGACERDRWRIAKVAERLRAIALGGTAVGTSFGATRDYVFRVERHLREITGLNLSRSQNLPDEISNNDKYAEAANAIAALAINIQKLSADMQIYTSSLCGELGHPELQYGSTIMAAKTNPVLLEYAQGLALAAESRAQLVGRYAASGRLQLNSFLPFGAEALLECADMALRALAALARGFLPLVSVNVDRIEANLYASQAMLNMLVPRLGYAAVKALYRDYLADPPRDRQEFVARVSGLSGLAAEEVEGLIRPERCSSASG